MNETINIMDITCRLLIPNDTLNVLLFDVHGKMHSDVREMLLANARFIIGKTIGGIKGLVVHDICLNGSSAGYFYHDKSDIDMRIEIHNQSCPYLTRDPIKLSQFLHMAFGGSLKGYNFRHQNRKIDIKLTADQFEIVGLYSILQDKWIIEPSKKFTDGLVVDDILNEFNTRYDRISSYLESFKGKTKGLEPSKQKELEDFYSNLIRKNNASPREYIVYKLLNYSGIIREIQYILSEGVKAYLTVE